MIKGLKPSIVCSDVFMIQIWSVDLMIKGLKRSHTHGGHQEARIIWSVDLMIKGLKHSRPTMAIVNHTDIWSVDLMIKGLKQNTIISFVTTF